MDRYIRRVIDDELDNLAPYLPAILLDGPKGVGKTSTATQRARTVLRLDDPSQAMIAMADPDRTLQGRPPILIDEWQRAPAIWDAIKRAVDKDNTGGRFLLTGSAPTARHNVHSGAGRIVTLRMRPLTLSERGYPTTVSLAQLLASDGMVPLAGRSEVGLEAYIDEALKSGLPGLRHLSGRALAAALDSYLELLLNRDIDEFGLALKRPQTMRSWLTAYSAALGTTASFETIRRAAVGRTGNPPARSTVQTYIEALDAIRILDRIPAWIPGRGHLGRLTEGLKHNLVDPALAARLIGITREKLLRGDGTGYAYADTSYAGSLFEALAALSVRVFAQAAGSKVGHLRTYGGEHEIDLIVENADGRVIAIETKLSGVVTDRDVRHLTWLKEEIGDQLIDRVVLNTGPGAYRRSDGVAVVPLALLGP